ncbi:MAG TPA: alpha/beta hydrolase [Candidatus Dormibacteraeota bacterium]
MGTVLIVESLTVDIDGPVHYADYGGTGDPLVLVHGLGGSYLNWMSVADRLAIRHRVYAVDLRGFGLTAMRRGQHATLEDNQALLEGFLERVVGGPATLIGNSMGGRLSLQVAAHRPELVRRLVLVDPAAPNPTLGGVDGLVVVFFAALLAPMAEPYLRRRSRRMGAEKIVRTTLAVVCEDPNRIPLHVYQAHLELAQRRLAQMPWSDRALVEAARSLLKLIFRRRVYNRVLAGVQAPVLIVHGARDRLVPVAAVRELVRLRPDWHLEVLDGIGHVPMLEAPDRFLVTVNPYLEVPAEQRAG